MGKYIIDYEFPGMLDLGVDVRPNGLRPHARSASPERGALAFATPNRMIHNVGDLPDGQAPSRARHVVWPPRRRAPQAPAAVRTAKIERHTLIGIVLALCLWAAPAHAGDVLGSPIWPEPDAAAPPVAHPEPETSSGGRPDAQAEVELAQTTPAVPVIGPGTPCTASWQMPSSYTGALTEYEVYVDIAAPTPTTGPTRTVPAASIPSAAPYAITWSICGNLPNLAAGSHTIAVAAKNTAGVGGPSAVVPFVFELAVPPAPIFSSPPVL